MDIRAIIEIGNIIRVRNKLFGRKLTTKEIINSYEYQIFKNKYPKLCELAEKDLHERGKEE